MDSMYEMLMGLPLFKGASGERISGIVEMTRFHFLKYGAGSVVVEAGAPCTHIRCLIGGRVRTSAANRDGRLLVEQTLGAPAVLAPEFLFGKAPFYPCKATALVASSVLQISKNDYMKILNADEVFMYNYLNTVSMHAQKAVEGLLSVGRSSLEERMAFWVMTLTQRGATDIVLRGRLRDLASVFGVQRAALVAALDGMRQRAIVDYDNQEVRVLSREAMVELIAADTE